MPIPVSCPQCGYDYTVRDEAAGRKFQCRRCDAVVSVPSTGSPWLESDEVSLPEVEPERSARDREMSRLDPWEAQAASLRPSTLGRASLYVGLGAWGLILAGIVLSIVLVVQLQPPGGGRQPNDEEALLIGVSFCCPSCVSLVGAVVGCVLGGMALSEAGTSRGAAIGGLVLNGLIVLGCIGLIIIGIFKG